MRRVRAMVSLALCIFFALGTLVFASADSFSAENVKLELPDGFIRLTAKNLSKHSSLLRSLGYDESSFKKELNSDGMLLFAVTEDASCQINMRMTETSLSERIGYLGDQPAARAEEIAAALEADINAHGYSQVLSRGTVSSNGIMYINLSVNVQNGDKNFCYMQYYTIVNGCNYSLVYYNDSAELTDAEQQECAALLASLKIKNTSSGGVDYSGSVQIVIATAAIILLLVLLAWIIISLAKDYRRHKAERSVQHLNRKQ